MKRDELRARILATSAPKPVPVTLPEWGTVFVKPLLVGEIEATAADADPTFQTARGLARMLCDEEGSLIFDVGNLDDLKVLNGLRASSLNLIHSAMESANHSTEGAAKELGNGSPPATVSSST